MKFDTIKKQLARGNQYLAEKFSVAKGTDKGENYKLLTTAIDNYKHFYEQIHKKVSDVIELNRGIGSKLKVANKLRGDHYTNSEKALAECLTTFGVALSLQPELSGSLIGAGDAFQKISEAKEQAVEETKHGFLYPINETLNKDISEIAAYRVKVEKRRLTYDSTKAFHQRANQSSVQELEENRLLFEEALEVSTMAMKNFLDGEVGQIEAVTNFVKAQLAYHETAVEALTSLQTELQSRLQTATENAANNQILSLDTTFEDDSIVNGVLKSKRDLKSSSATCQALYDFKPETDYELALKEGDIVTLIQQVDEHWFYGELNDCHGYFPTNYVKVLVPLSS